MGSDALIPSPKALFSEKRLHSFALKGRQFWISQKLDVSLLRVLVLSGIIVVVSV